MQETDLQEQDSHVHVEDVLFVQEIQATSYVQQHLVAPEDTAAHPFSLTQSHR